MPCNKKMPFPWGARRSTGGGVVVGAVARVVLVGLGVECCVFGDWTL